MRRDRPEPLDLVESVPQLGREPDPLLTQLARWLDDAAVFQKGKADLAQRSPQTLTRGRPSPPGEVVRRLIAVKRLDRWSDAETAPFVADSLVLRQFCRVSREAVPDDPTRIRWANRIGPTTIAPVNARGVELARALKVPRGRKRRPDPPAVETTTPPRPTVGSRGMACGW
jgi:IS5 family transposase